MVSYRNGVSILELITYIPLLVVAVILAITHGFGRNSGWIFVVIFSLSRIIAPCFQLATIHDPSNTDLYAGAASLYLTGLSPLFLAALGLLSRVIANINKVQRTLPGLKQLKLVGLIVLVGLLFGVLGGISASKKLKDNGTYKSGTLSKLAVVLFAITYVLLVLCVLSTAKNVSHAEPGEKRILLAVGLSLPFLFVRLIYSILSVFDTHSTTFNAVSGNVTVWLFLALLMEFIVVITFEGMGLTLKKLENYGRPDGVTGASPGASPQQQPPYGYPSQPEGQQPYYGKRNDVEMQHNQQR